MQEITARDIMTTNPVMVREDQSIAQVLAILKSKGVSGAPVQDADGVLAGLVSLKDIAFDALWRGDGGGGEQVGYLVSSSEPKEPLDSPNRLEIPKNLKVRDIMTPMVFTVPADAPLTQIAKDMSKGRVHRLVVLEEDTVVGIVSSLDLLKAFGQK